MGLIILENVKTDGTLVCLLEPEITQVGVLYIKTVAIILFFL